MITIDTLKDKIENNSRLLGLDINENFLNEAVGSLIEVD